MLKLINIQKSYFVDKEPVPVLKGINLEFQKGELVSLLGESGCGKSTLLNIITGLDVVNEGEIFFNDVNVTKFNQNEWAQYRKNNIGYIFQNFNLISHLSVQENVELVMTLDGQSKQQRQNRAKELLEMVGLGDKLKYEPNRLSGGQKQRVAIARALANDPDILVADEPTGALDSQTAIQIMEILKGLAEKGKLVILVTHSLELAEWGNRIVRLKDGEVLSNEVKRTAAENTSVSVSKKGGKLSFFSSVKLASQNLKQKKWRTLLTALGASIGIGGIALMVGLGIGAQNKVNSELEKLTDQRSVTIQTDEKNPQVIPDEKIEELKDNPNVADVLGVYAFYGSVKQTDPNKAPVNLILAGLNPYKERGTFEKDNIIEGKYPKDGEKGIYITEKDADNLFGKDAKYQDLIGEEINMTVSTQLDGVQRMFKTVDVQLPILGVVKNGSFGLSICYIPYDFAEQTYQQSTGETGMLQANALAKNTQVVDEVKKAAEEQKLKAKTSSEQLDQINSYFVMIQAALGSFAGISLVVSAIMIAIVMYVSVLERTREIGTMKALGARRKDIKRIFLSEAAVIGVLGGLFGVIGGYLLGLAGNEILKSFLKENAFKAFVVPGYLAAFCIIFSTVISMIAGYIPARRAAKLNAVDALRYE
ncbi:ATP-binding cassette domain-containing protein [Bacillus sp. 03113]|uniref:ABC transporter ATP-binding protein/permease n=1 Tax=Bacillus sp. 03113 TaxID=2578211 RepID=UPI00114190E9|nr:ABC transporter ATP-binding protein/permease [Bacillus sp. 03113]